MMDDFTKRKFDKSSIKVMLEITEHYEYAYEMAIHLYYVLMLYCIWRNQNAIQAADWTPFGAAPSGWITIGVMYLILEVMILVDCELFVARLSVASKILASVNSSSIEI